MRIARERLDNDEMLPGPGERPLASNRHGSGIRRKERLFLRPWAAA